MFRSILGFALFAVIALVVLKVVFSVLGVAIGLFFQVLWLALIGFAIYLLLKVFAPETAARIRETFTGKSG